MIYLIAVFFPFVYFFMKGRVIAGVIHTIICFVSLVLVLSMIGVVIGIPLWGVSAVCAVWDLRRRLLEEQATIMAQKMAAAIRPALAPSQQASIPPPPIPAERLYRIGCNGQDFGEHTMRAIKDMLQNGTISQEDYYLDQPTNEWQPVHRLTQTQFEPTQPNG